MADRQKLTMMAAIAVFLIIVVAAVIAIKAYVWTDEPEEFGAVPSNSAAIPTTEPQSQEMPDFSKLRPRFTSTDFRHDAVIMDKPNGKIACQGGVYFIESSAGTLWVWNRPWGYQTSDFACEAVGRVATSPEGAWSLYVTSKETPRQGICVTIHGDGTLEIGRNAFADSGNDEIHVGPLAHPAIKAATEFNRLLVVLRGQELTVLVNGVSVCEPVRIQEHVLPGVIALSGSAGPDEASRAEFTSCTLWRLRN